MFKQSNVFPKKYPDCCIFAGKGRFCQVIPGSANWTKSARNGLVESYFASVWPQVDVIISIYRLEWCWGLNYCIGLYWLIQYKLYYSIDLFTIYQSHHAVLTVHIDINVFYNSWISCTIVCWNSSKLSTRIHWADSV